MTLNSFKNRVICAAILLRIQGQPSDLASVIWWDSEWHHKWALAMNGIYDA